MSESRRIHINRAGTDQHTTELFELPLRKSVMNGAEISLKISKLVNLYGTIPPENPSYHLNLRALIF